MIARNTESFRNTQRPPCRSASRTRSRRRGAATVWLIILLPLLVILLGVVIEITHLWVARVELENSLEAAALAAVKEWGDANGGLGTAPARNVGVEFAQLNCVNGVPVEIGSNLGLVAANNPNLNRLCDPQKSDMDLTTLPRPDGNLVFGSIIDNNGTLEFHAELEPSCGCVCDVIVEAKGNRDELGTCDPMNDFGWKICFDNCVAGAMVQKIEFEIPNAMGGQHFNNAAGIPDFGCNVPAVPPHTVVFDPPMNPKKVTICFTDPMNLLDPTDYPCAPANPLRFGMGLQGFGSPPGCPGAGNSADNLATSGVTVNIEFVVNGMTEDCGGVFSQGPVLCDNMVIAELSGATGRDFGVRAQSLAQIKPIFCQFSGIDFGPFCVCVVTTARFRCETGKPELIRIEPENVICAPGLGADP
ncbi:MAG: pilus assembly protein TadG-related protein [Pirellulaceae bacterium]